MSPTPSEPNLTIALVLFAFCVFVTVVVVGCVATVRRMGY